MQIQVQLIQTIISIHAPAEGATTPDLCSEDCFSDFNPRSRGGSDLIQQNKTRALMISIHAPAEGATGAIYKKFADDPEFQSTLPRRERRG